MCRAVVLVSSKHSISSISIQSYSTFSLVSFFNLSRRASRHVSFRMQTTNHSLSTMSSPVTASSHSCSGSTLAPPVNTPAPPPSQPVSVPDDNSLAQAISRALADSLPSLLSSLRDYSGGNTNMATTSGSFISASNSTVSGIFELHDSQLYIPDFRYAGCSLFYFNLWHVRRTFGGLFFSRHVHQTLAHSGWGLLSWRNHICVLHVSKPQRRIRGGSWLCCSPV